MSMLSAQCDELRNLAGDGSVEFVAGPIRADVLRMAADTIWELRCKLNDEQDENVKMREQMEFDRQMSRSRAELIDRLKAENAKLREDLSKWERLAAGIDLPEYPVTQFKPKDLERENAKLRELVRDMWPSYCWANTGDEAFLTHEHDVEIRDRIRELVMNDD